MKHGNSIAIDFPFPYVNTVPMQRGVQAESSARGRGHGKLLDVIVKIYSVSGRSVRMRSPHELPTNGCS